MLKQIEPTDKKFTESFKVSDWEIETEDGWKDITHFHKTIKYDVWELQTTNHTLKCADDHIVMVDGFNERFVKDLKINDLVMTNTGLEKVVLVRKLSVDPEEMYDLTVNSKTHTLYTNGILSHNSTISSIFLTWYVLFHNDKTVAIMANKESLAIELLDKIKMSYKNLPVWLQQGIIDGGWNRKMIVLQNGSRIIASATSSSALTGFTINLLYLDEFAKVPQHIADDFIASVYPVITSGKTSKIIMISTPLGLNQFYNFWVGATRKDGNENSFYPISVGWWEVPGHDEKFKKKIIKDISLQRWNQEFACQFLGSNSSLIDSDVLERIVYKVPKSTKWTGLFLVYEEPLSGKEYVVSVDTAKGTGYDYSVIQVIKINSEIDLEQVAVYRNNTIMPHDFSQVCVSIAQYYNNAHMMIENNDIGSSVADSVWHELEYENLVNLDPRALGVRSTKKSKKVANMLLKEYMEKNWLKVCDEKTVYELSRYEEIKPGVYAAGRHENDDCFKEDALVKTKRGYVEIKDVVIGDEVLTHMGRWKKVSNVIKKDFDGEWYDIKFKSQLNMSCSYNHPIYTSDRDWLLAKNWDNQSCISVKMPLRANSNRVLNFDDYVAPMKNMGNIKRINITLDDKFAKFLGLFLAEGCCDRVKCHHYVMSLAFHQKEVDSINEMMEYISTLGITPRLDISKYDNGCRVSFSNKFLYNVLSECYDENRNKILPSYAFDLGDDLRYVLEYWLRGDGWVNKNLQGKTKHAIGVSISKKLALDMRDIAISIGKKANIQEVTKKKKGEHNQFWVIIYDDYNQNCKSHSVMEISNFEVMSKLSYKKKQPLIQKSYYKGTVYDISVKDDESFMCNGIIVHNCVTSLLWAIYFIKSDDFEGKSYDKNHIQDEYNVEFGSNDNDEELPNNELKKIGEEPQGDPNWRPSAIMDEDNF